MLTFFIGGNHEASSYNAELYVIPIDISITR
jgi:hypothetical protein